MRAGLGIRPELFGPVLEQKPDVGFFEAHSENYFGSSLARAKLLELRTHYPVSLHGVGLSLGRADDLDEPHLAELKSLADEVDPMFVSEHLSWSAYSHRHLPDLLPLPLTEKALATMCDHIDRMQTALGRRVLVENPSNYLLFDQLQIPEPEFLNELASRSGCGLLLDVNNVYVSAHNLGRSAQDYVLALHSASICQYHLAGYTIVDRPVDGGTESVYIDTHDHPVYPEVWQLFEQTVGIHGAKPTLFEWDSDFPEFNVLLAECEKADRYLERQKQATKEVTTRVDMIATGVSKTTGVLSKTAGAHSKTSDAQGLKRFQEEFLEDLLQQKDGSAFVSPTMQQRFSVYQNNVFGALQDYLADLFPATRGVLGDAFFKQTAQQFVQDRPPQQGNLHSYGENFYSFTSSLDALESLPYIGDLARLEWHLHNVYYANDAENIDLSMDQNQLLNLPVRLSKGHAIINSDFPIFEIHRQSLPDFVGDVSISLDQSADAILVYKQGFAVEHQLLTEPQVIFLNYLAKSDTLMQAIEALAGSMEQNDLSDALALVFNANLLRRN